MRARTTFLLLVVFGVLLVYVVRFELPKPSEEEERAGRLELIGIESGHVVGLSLETSSYRAELQRDDSGRWYMSEPFVDRADDTNVYALLEELLPLRSVAAVPTGRADMISYRLDRPTVVATFRYPTGAGYVPYELRVGRKNTAFDAYYAIVNEDTTATGLIPSVLVEGYLLKDPVAFRNAMIADFAIEDPKTIVIATPTSRVVLERELGTRTWSITSPVAAAADQPVVNDLVRRFGVQRVEEYVDEDPQDLSRYGLDPPSMILTVVLENELRETLQLGAEVGDGSGAVYGRTARRPTVFTLSEGARLELSRTLFELREKDLVSIEPPAVRGLRLDGGGTQLAVVRDGDTWREVGGEKRRLRRVSIDQAVQNLTVLEARAFADDPAPELVAALERPFVTAALAPAAGDTLHVAFARHDDATYVRVRPGGAIARVDADDPTLLLGLLETPPWQR